MRFTAGLLSFVTVGFFIGSFSQLALIRQLEDSHGISLWKNDKEAEILRVGYIKPEVLSWSPRIILLHNFLSMEECEYLKAIAHTRLIETAVIDPKTGMAREGIERTSSGMFLNSQDRKHPMAQAIEKRISVYAQVPIENGEPMQILRYEKNQYFNLHYDFFPDTYKLEESGQRIATMLMYISDNADGGETYFPMAGSGECSCGGKILEGLSVKPIKGNAVLFWSMGLWSSSSQSHYSSCHRSSRVARSRWQDGDGNRALALGLSGEQDPNSVHKACEALSGTKWSAVKWMRERAHL